MSEAFFEALIAIMGVSLLATVLLRRLRLPSIVAYILAGALIGPQLLGWVQVPAMFSFLAEFGVVFLLFALGLEFSLPKLIALRRSVFGLGSIQVALCTAVFAGAVWLWGTTLSAAVLIAGALALSSTAIVSKELSQLHKLHQRPGQLAIAILLFQDLAAIVFLILVPVLGEQSTHSFWYSMGLALIKAVLLMGILLSAGKWLLPLLYKEVSRARSEEVFVLTTLVIVMLAAWITHSFHLSMALGGFVIGMMLSESAFRHQIESDIRPFKDILLGLFFVTIGMNIQINLVWEYWPRLLCFTAALILIKALLISLLVNLTGDNKSTAIQSGLNLAQAGEFGLALLSLAVLQKVIPNDQASFIILVSIFSMTASPFLIRYSDTIASKLLHVFSRWKQSDEEVTTVEEPAVIPNQKHVIIGGFGRVGKTLGKILGNNNIDYIAIDQHIDVVNTERSRGANVIYGDCENLELLKHCHIQQAELAILTFTSLESAKKAIEHIRAEHIDTPIIVRCHEHNAVEELIALGANHVIPEMLEASLLIAAQVLTLAGMNQSQIDQQIALERANQLRTPNND